MQAAWRSWSAYQNSRDPVNSLTDLREDLRDVLPAPFGAAADGCVDLVGPLPPGSVAVLVSEFQECVEEFLAIAPLLQPPHRSLADRVEVVLRVGVRVDQTLFLQPSRCLQR